MKAPLLFFYWLATHAMEGAIWSKHNHSTILQDDWAVILFFFFFFTNMSNFPKLPLFEKKKKRYAEQRHKNGGTRLAQGTGAGELAGRAESTCS